MPSFSAALAGRARVVREGAARAAGVRDVGGFRTPPICLRHGPAGGSSRGHGHVEPYGRSDSTEGGPMSTGIKGMIIITVCSVFLRPGAAADVPDPTPAPAASYTRML